ncbi:MAG: WD40 repeat domain-containing protein [Mycobacteriaceae bacterium]
MEARGAGLHPRTDFADRFAILYELAGRPALKRLAERANVKMVPADARRPVRLSAQRLSDWRTGRAVPARFDGLAAVLKVMITSAQARTPEPPVEGLYSLPDWHNRWQLAQRSNPIGSGPAGKFESTSGLACPYRGLAAFETEDASLFFGRERAVSALQAKVIGNIDGVSVTFLVGASGSGKSSLLHAGLVPALAAERKTVVFSPGRNPIQSLRLVLSQMHEPGKFVLIVDQFEEIFTQCDDEETRRLFVVELCSVTAREFPNGALIDAVVVATRSDFYEQCLRYSELAEALEHHQMVLGPMTREELSAAVSGPSRAVGVALEPGLVDIMIRDLGADVSLSAGGVDTRYNAGALPLLAHALLATWDAREGNQLTVLGYTRSGGVRGAIAGTAEAAWDTLTDIQKQAARKILVQLVKVSEDGRDTRRRVARESLLAASGDRQAAAVVLNSLTQARLIISDSGGAELIHEAVIDGWPRLAGWLMEDRSGTLLRQRLDRDAEDWAQHQRNGALLYRGVRLDAALAWAADNDEQLTTLSREFLDTGKRQGFRSKIFTRSSLVALVLFMVASIIAAGIAVRQRDSANNERNDAVFAEVTAQAARTQSSDPSLSAQLSLVAAQMRSDNDTAISMVQAAQNFPLAMPMLGHEGAVYHTAVGPTGIVASASYDKTIRLWDISDSTYPRQIGQPLIGHSSWVTSVAFSPDGKILVSGSGDSTVRLWDISDPNNARPLGVPLSGHTGAVYMVAFSPDGRTVASASDDRTVRLWNIDDPLMGVPRGQPLTGHRAAVRSVAFSSDGGTLATGSDDNTAILWNLADLSTPIPWSTPVSGHSNTIHSVAFSQNGLLLATGSDDQTVRLWDITTPANPVALGGPLTGHSAAIWSVAFSPESDSLVAASWDGTARVWGVRDPVNPVLLGQPLAGSSGGLTTATFARAGSAVITGGQDGIVRVWTLSPSVLEGHTRRVATPAFDKSGRLMVTGSHDGTILVWSRANPDQPKVVGRTRSLDGLGVENIALTPDGMTLATASLGSGRVQLWDMTTPDRLNPIAAPLVLSSRYTHELAFSPDSHTLATANDDQSIKLWDISIRDRPSSVGAVLVGPTGWINSVSFSPDGKFLAAASSDKTIKLWEVSADAGATAIERPLVGHSGAVNSVAFSADGRLLASASDDQTIRLWDVKEAINQSDADVSILTGHRSTVRSVAFSPDGDTLASGSDDQTVRLWSVVDAADPKARGGSLTPAGIVRWRVAFAPEGGYLVSSGEGGAVRNWQLDAQNIRVQICKASKDVLNEHLWNQYLPRLGYSPPCAKA